MQGVRCETCDARRQVCMTLRNAFCEAYTAMSSATMSSSVYESRSISSTYLTCSSQDTHTGLFLSRMSGPKSCGLCGMDARYGCDGSYRREVRCAARVRAMRVMRALRVDLANAIFRMSAALYLRHGCYARRER